MPTDIPFEPQVSRPTFSCEWLFRTHGRLLLFYLQQDAPTRIVPRSSAAELNKLYESPVAFSKDDGSKVALHTISPPLIRKATFVTDDKGTVPLIPVEKQPPPSRQVSGGCALVREHSAHVEPHDPIQPMKENILESTSRSSSETSCVS